MGKNKNKKQNTSPALNTAVNIPEKKEEVTKPVEEIKKASVDGVKVALNIRSTPDANGDNIIDVIQKDTSIEVYSSFESDEWYKVKVNNKTGYAMKKFIKII